MRTHRLSSSFLNKKVITKHSSMSQSIIKQTPIEYSIQAFWLSLFLNEIKGSAFLLYLMSENKPVARTKSCSISGVELSNSTSWRKRSSKNAFKDKYPASKHLYHRFLFKSSFQLVIAFGSISMSGESSVMARGCIAARTDEQFSWPRVTTRLNLSKSENRFQTPTVSRNEPAQNITKYWAYFPCLLDYLFYRISV